ncbi:MAG: hypothetical protein CMJ51_06575 [Planctomycetaceae bacterium]|nr:hypothetical protein [Planctomycetaceae bacterium]
MPTFFDALRVTAASSILIGVSAVASPSEPPASSDDPGSGSSPVRRVIVPKGMEGTVRPPLLREGGILMKVRGSIHRDTDLGVQVFHPDQSQTGGVDRELILLPSRGLDDLARLEDADNRADSDDVRPYEVTGRILVYRGRNFLLPDLIVPLEVLAPVVPTVNAPPATSEPAGVDDDDLDRIGDDLEKRLESRIGAVPRSLDVRDAPISGAGLIPTGTRFVDRRGRLSRDPASGVWRFVLASKEGGETSSVVLLPCLELQRIEQRARQQDVSRAILLSGVVTSYRGRNYLLPTMTRMANEGRGIGY